MTRQVEGEWPGDPLGRLDRALAFEGWERRFVSPPERLFEHVDLYNSLGYEVRLELVPAESLGGECTACSGAFSHHRVVYTRRSG
jgi:hypothetical protein